MSSTADVAGKRTTPWRQHRFTFYLGSFAFPLLLALALRLLLWGQPPHQPANDEFEYIQVARDIVAGRGWVFYERWRWLRAPLYPLFLAGSLRLAGGDLHLAALPNILLSTGVVALIAGLTRELDPQRRAHPAWLAGLAAALLITAATFASLFMAETLFAFLLGAALLQLIRWERAGANGLWRLALAGFLLGLACLTRSAALPFVPLAGLWAAVIVWRRYHAQWHWRRPALVGGLLLAACALTILPWTLRNCAAYGRCILIETGLSYNLWAFNEPPARLDEIHRTLEAIANPAERADLATARGLARLRADPLSVLRRLPSAWVALWAVNPIQDRFLLPSYYADPPPLIFLGGLLLDDLLYLLILVGATLGMARALARRDPAAWLCALWLSSVIGATLLTHAEGRYRHFFWVVLIPCAALALPRRKEDGGAGAGPGRLTLRARVGVGAMLAALLLPWLAYYPWAWASGGAVRSLARQAGDLLAAAGADDLARRTYADGLARAPSPDLWLALGHLQRRAGDLDGAETAYRAAMRMAGPYPASSAHLGDLLRASGRDAAARAAFDGRYLGEQQLLDWSFAFLSPPPRNVVDLGDGLDFGYVGGAYPAEPLQGASARWGGATLALRLSPPGHAPSAALALTMRAAAPHPGQAAVRAQVCRNGTCQPITLGPTWRIVRVALPAGAGPIELRSPTFSAPDGRSLGVLVDWARVTIVGPQHMLGTCFDRPAARGSAHAAA